ncbi:MAG TPA: hypothetical protein VK608_00290 [Edaphobacter sp.]|nr:hypothetical protein [Edaphobacter sp.]
MATIRPEPKHLRHQGRFKLHAFVVMPHIHTNGTYKPNLHPIPHLME